MANSKKYYWLKLKEDFFRDKPIKKLRKIAGGDTYTIIYLKLMLLSLREGGNLFFDGIENDFAEELALDLDEDADNVRFTMLFLLESGLLEEVNEHQMLVTKMPELTGSETAGAERARRFRQNQKALQNNADALRCNTDVTERNTEIEKELDKRVREKSKEQEGDILTAKNPPASPRAHIDYLIIQNLYNQICTSLPKCTVLSDARKKAIKARFANGSTIIDFETLFKKAEDSSFLKGSNARNWSATFDWLIKDANMAKVLDGNYDDTGKGSPERNGFQTSNPFLEMLQEERESG